MGKHRSKLQFGPVREQRGKHPKIQPAFFGALESRILYSTINVANYGANGNDGNDDRNAIVAAINASHDGDTIFFPAGTYLMSRQISTKDSDLHVKLGRGRVYQGATQIIANSDGSTTVIDGSILVGTGVDPGDPTHRKNAIFSFRENNPNPNFYNVKYTQLTFRGRGLNLDADTGYAEGIVVDNCHFDVRGRNLNNGIEFAPGIRNLTVTNNVFWVGGDNGIYGYNYDKVTIANNQFLNPPQDFGDGTAGNEGIHIIPGNNTSCSGLLIEQNYFSGLHRMAIEYQGGGVGTKILDNWYENPVMYPTLSQNNDTFAYSIVADTSHNSIVQRNVAIAPERPDGKGVRIMFEMGGYGWQVNDNYTDGGDIFVASNGSGGNGTVYSNHYTNATHGIQFNNGSTGTAFNNGANVVVSFDPFGRGRPGPNRRFGEAISPPPPPPNFPATPINLGASNVTYNEVDLAWVDQADNETGYRVEQLDTDGFTWVNISGTLPANTISFNVTGLAELTTFQFRVVAFNDNGDSPSGQAGFTTRDSGVPLGPTNLVGTTVGLNEVDLTWTDNSFNETGFIVQRLAEDGVTWVQMAVLGANSTGYQMMSLGSGQTYNFRVLAYRDGYVDQPASNIATVQTPLKDVTSTLVVAPTRRKPFSYTGLSTTTVTPPIGAGA